MFNRIFNATFAYKTVRVVIITARVGFLSFTMYTAGSHNGVVQYLENPTLYEEQTLKGIMLNFRAKVILQKNDPTVVQVKRVVDRLVPAARVFVKQELNEVQTQYKAKFGSVLTGDELHTTGVTIDKRILIEQYSYWDRALRELDGQWSVIVIDTPVVNAFVTDLLKRRIFVTTGFMSSLKPTSEELAIVLGHELSHLIHNHVCSNTNAVAILAALQMIILALLDPIGVTSLLWDIGAYFSAKVVDATYHRMNETEADETGIKIAALACYNTKHGSEIFRKLAVFSNTENKGTGWTDTHPNSELRFHALDLASKEFNSSKYIHCSTVGRNLHAIGLVGVWELLK